MAPCDEYQTRMVALFDNEAGDEDLRLVAGHLQDCPECRAFYLDLVTIRRAGATAPMPSLSPGVRQAVLGKIEADQADRTGSRTIDWSGMLRFGGLGRWAAVLVIGSLLITCFVLGRTAKDLRLKLGAAEQQVAASHEQAKLAESQERQQKAISALYFRMAELEERVNRASPSQRASFPVQAYDRRERQNNF
ncbi:MAG: zf-HC2 domain-containing protein [Phycisphaerae bacterium]|nr:zf-HC2 domain-containing protein [Phycisphaerae bacterium]